MPEEAPPAALLWDTLVQAMQHPAAGEPHRPTELQVRADDRWEALRRHLEEIGVGLAVAGGLDQTEAVFNEMCAHLCGKPRPGLLDMPGVTPHRPTELQVRPDERWEALRPHLDQIGVGLAVAGVGLAVAGEALGGWFGSPWRVPLLNHLLPTTSRW
jgi:hypothetical protein